MSNDQVDGSGAPEDFQDASPENPELDSSSRVLESKHLNSTKNPFPEVLKQITEPLRKREGFRHLWLGDSGMGKTKANSILVEWILQTKQVDAVLTIDNKDRWKAQYNGCFRANPNHLRQNPPSNSNEARHIVFRGIALTRDLSQDVEVRDVAQMGWDMVRLHPCTICLNVDELADATNGHQGWSSEEVAQIYRKGRSVGYSVIAGNQLPQLLPREAFGLSETIAIFRMSAREARYLKDYRVITEEEIDEIANLQVGEFRLYRKSYPVDRSIYKFKL